MTVHKKILVADDSEASVQLHETLLRAKHYVVVKARDGQQAVEKAKTELPDLILMDLIMPKMSGLEACRLIRAHGATKHIPILVVTMQSDDAEDICRKINCNDYVTKPVDGADLLVRIRRLLGEGE